MEEEQIVPQSIDQLREIVNTNSRKKFVTKILYCLNFMNSINNDPNYLQQIGCAWCKDKSSFIANSLILGNFLKLKANTINTNFREHGFQVITNSDVKKDFPSTCSRNWKKRTYIYGTFNSCTTFAETDDFQIVKEMGQMSDKGINTFDHSSSEEQIFRSPFQIGRKQQDNVSDYSGYSNYLIQPAKLWPESTKKLICGQEYVEQQQEILKILLTLSTCNMNQNKVMEAATSIWTKVIGPHPGCPMLFALQKLIPERDMPKNVVCQLRVNFLNLLNSQLTSSQFDNESIATKFMTFDIFLNYFIRYGSPLDPQSQLAFITGPPYPMIDKDKIDFEHETYEDPPSFRPGFMMLNRKSDVLLAFQSTQIVQPWCVIHSKQPNRFALYTIIQPSTQPVIIYINYNCVEESTEKFSVKFGEEIVYKSCWADILELLQLNLDNGIYITTIMDNKVKVIDGEGLLSREGEEPLNIEQEPLVFQSNNQVWNELL